MKVKNWFFVVVLAAVFFLIMGLGQTKILASQSGSGTSQYNLQTAKHWKALAQDVSRDISKMYQMAEKEYPGSIHQKPLRIITRETSSFSTALESFLNTDLTHLGIRVDNEASDPYLLYWSVQPVNHIPQRSPARVPENEIVVNVTIQDGDDIIYRTSNVYNIRDDEKDHYHLTKDLYYSKEKAQTRTVNVRGEVDPRPIPYEDTFDVIFFQFDEYEIKEEYKDTLDRHVELLKEHPDIPVVIEGHTDSIGSEEYNLNLSQQRAEAVYNYFVERNISSDRLHKKGHAFFKPLAPNVTEDGRDNPEGRAKNRRAEIQW
ncbi:OmpA family protein, partial [Desulfonatronospira sp.]|uniref:OmpA family protein n=1 Tax=Desulfonatronospira sp. TaxID=1962951 RepID=UPI0025C49EB0